MKNLIKIVALALVLVMSVTALAACGDKASAIKSAFEGEGYTVSSVKYADMDDDTKYIVSMFLSDEQADKMEDYAVMLCSEKSEIFGKEVLVPKAIIVKCDSADSIKDFLCVKKSDGSVDTTVYEKAVDKGYINGNCYIMSLDSGAIEIFKNA